MGREEQFELKIMINISPLTKAHGGAELVAYKLALRLSLKGNTIFLVTFYHKGSQLIEKVNKNFIIFRVPYISIIGNVFHNFVVLFLTLRINPQIIFDQGIFGFGLLARLTTGKPYIVYGRGTDVYRICSSKGVKGFILKRFAKIILKQASLAIALSENMKTSMKQILNRQIVVLTNGVNLEEIKLNAAKKQEKFGEKQLLFVGNVRPIKGVEYLIEAMQIVAKKQPTARLVIVGSYNPDFARKIPRNLREKILLKGFVENKNIPSLMKNSDIFILPSISEGIPNVVLEAMAVGLPIVATRVGGVPELIKDAENGFLVPARSSEQLAEKILLLLNDENLRERISQNNLNASKKYDINKITSILEEYFTSIASTSVKAS
jgi:glycosyltransferase involved in cell wall biosynthesis